MIKIYKKKYIYYFNTNVCNRKKYLTDFSNEFTYHFYISMNPCNQSNLATIIKLDDRGARGWLRVEGIAQDMPFSFAELASNLSIPDLYISRQVLCEVELSNRNNKVEIYAKKISKTYREKKPKKQVYIENDEAYIAMRHIPSNLSETCVKVSPDTKTTS
jgi:hypothetical protein